MKKLKKKVLLNVKYGIAIFSLSVLVFVTVFKLRELGYVSAMEGYLIALVSFFSAHAFLTHRKEKHYHKDAGTTPPAWYEFAFQYVWKRIVGIFATFGLIGLFFLYNNDIAPATAPGYLLVNEKTGQEVYFQGMAHIGSEDFYDDVNAKVKSYTSSGFVLYYEKVIATDDAEMDELAGKIGVKPSADLYENIGTALGRGITSQDNDEILSHAKKSKHSDVSVSELLGKGGTGATAEYLTGTHSTGSSESGKPEREMSLKEKEIAKATEDLNMMLESLVKSRNKTLPYMMQGVFNFVMKNSWLQDLSMWMQKPEDQDVSFFEDRVVNYRNSKLAKDVLDGGDGKVFITYGMLHYEGFIKELNKQSVGKGNGEFKVKKKENIRIF